MADNINFDFSEREKDIINLIILGYSYKEISDTLFITNPQLNTIFLIL